MTEYDDFLRQVDEILNERFGLDTYSIEDWDWYTAWESGSSPEEAVEDALNDMGFNEDGSFLSSRSRKAKRMRRTRKRAAELEPGADVSVNFADEMVDDWVEEDDETTQLADIQDQARSDTASEADEDNRAPDTTTQNPASDTWPVESKVAARVFVKNAKKKRVVGSRVVIVSGKRRLLGRVLAVGSREFAVQWDDGIVSVEPRKDYQLVLK